MPKSNDTVPATTVPFVTIDDINSEHDRLVERFQGAGSDPKALCTEVFDFMRRVAATGSRLYSDSERSTAQSLLSYWSNLLYRYDVPPEQLPRNELDPYDPEAGADLRQAEFPFAEPDVLDDASPAQQRAWSRLMSEALDILQRNGLLVIIGAPGSGRSFLLRNALWPRLGHRGAVAAGAEPAPVRCFGIVKPGARPLHGLASALAPTAAPEEIETRVQLLRAEPASMVGQFDAGGPGALLAVDQLEELFAFASEQDTAAFLNAIAAWVQQQRHAILVCDSDTFTRLAGRDEFTARLNDAQLTVSFEATELRSLVEEPARRVGLIFDEGVLDRLLRDVQGDPAALALLQFTLQRVWKERSGQLRNRIKAETYQQLGGGWMALNRAAERVYRPSVKLSAGIKRLFTRMLSPHLGSGFTVTPVAIDSLCDEHTPPEAIEHIVAEFCEAGLLRIVEPEAGQPRKVTVTHPALLRHWPRAMEWLDEERVQKRGELMLRNVSEQWHTRRDQSLLWRGAMLAEARRYPVLNPVEESFLSASTRAQQMRSWIRGGAVAVIMLLLAGLAYQMHERSKVEQAGRLKAARDGGEKAFALAETHAEKGGQSLAKGDAAMAALWFSEGLGEVHHALDRLDREGAPRVPTDAVIAEMHRQRLTIALRQTPRLAQRFKQVRLLASDVDTEGGRVVTVGRGEGEAPGPVLLWEPSGESQPLVTDNGLPAVAVAFRPDGWMLTAGFASADGTRGALQTWEAGDRKPLDGFNTDGPVRSVVFSPELDRIAYWIEGSSGKPGKVVVWDRAAKKSETHAVATTVNRLVFSPDATRLAIALGDDATHSGGAAEIWPCEGGEALRIAHDATVSSVNFSPDGKAVVTASGYPEEEATGEARVWDADTGLALTPPLHHARKVAYAEFSPDGRRVATASSDGIARIWEVRTGRALLGLPHSGWVYEARFSPDGRHLATGSRDRNARVWDLATGRLLLPPFHQEGSVSRVWFADGGRRLAAAGGDAVRVCDLVTAMPSALAFEQRMAAAAFSPSGTRVLTASEPTEANDQVNTVQIVATNDGQKEGPARFIPATATCVAFSPDEQRIAAASLLKSGGAIVRVWEVGSNQPVERTVDGEVTQLVFSPPDGAQLLILSRASDNQPRIVTVWKRASEKPLIIEHQHAVGFVAFSPDGTRVVTGSGETRGGVREGAARVFDAVDGKLLATLPHNEAVSFAAFDKEGKWLATAGVDDAACVWNLTNDKEIIRIEKVHSADLTVARFSPDRRFLLTGSYDTTAVICDLKQSRPGAPVVRVKLPHGGFVTDAAFSPDGSRVLTASSDGNARLWDSTTGGLIAILPHGAAVRSAVFDDSGHKAFTLSFAPVRSKEMSYVPGSTPGRRSRLQEARIWTLEPDDRLPDELRTESELMAVQGIGGEALAAADSKWDKMRSQYAERTPRMVGRDHHLRETAFCETSERWFAAGWHLETAIRSMEDDPDPELLRRCGEAWANDNRWNLAEHYYDWAVLTLKPEDRLWGTAIYQRARMRSELHRWVDTLADCELMKTHPQAGFGSTDNDPLTLIATVYLDQAQDCTRHGKPEEAAEHFGKCLTALRAAVEAAKSRNDPGPWQRMAALQLKLNPEDKRPWQETCAAIWEAYKDRNAELATRIAWPFTLDRDADLEKLHEMLPPAVKLTQALPNEFRLNTLGALYYRLGDYPKALVALDRSRKTWAEARVRETLAQVNDETSSLAMAELEDGRPQDQVFLAMTHHQLSVASNMAEHDRAHHIREAQRWLRRALESYDEMERGVTREVGRPRRLWNEMEFRILLREAISLVPRQEVSKLNH